MRLKKKTTSIGVLGKILNLFSNSKEDTYSCDYINNKLNDDTGWIKMDSFQFDSYTYGYYRKKNGIVYISCRSGVLTKTNTYVTVFTLPVGFRPKYTIPFTYHTVGGDCSHQAAWVDPNGEIICYSPSSDQQPSFNISFPVN